MKESGVIIFAVHNPEKLDERKVADKMNVGGIGKIVNIHKRTAADYGESFRNAGFRKLFEKYPKTSRKFLEKYEQADSIKIPKYMVLAYKK